MTYSRGVGFRLMWKNISISSPTPKSQRSTPRCRLCTIFWRASAFCRSEEHTSELQSPCNLVCRLLLEKKKLRTTLLMASSVRIQLLNCSRSPCVYTPERLTLFLTLKLTGVTNYVQKASCQVSRSTTFL